MTKSGEHSTGVALSSTDEGIDQHQDRSSDGESTGGFARLLACCGILKAPSLPQIDLPSAELESTRPFDYEAATSKLLRKSTPSQSFSAVPHIRQLETWDCGIACLQMVLRWLHDEEGAPITASSKSSALSLVQNMERNLLLARVQTQSIWTVDLLMLLENLLLENKAKPQQPNHDNTTYLFCSQVMGVNADHSTTGYYEKAFTADSTRVDKICDDLKRLNLPVLCCRLEFEQLIDLISNHHCVAILLVDNHVLMLEEEHQDNNTQDTYTGHYVILCGISRDADHLVEAHTAEALAEQELTYCIAVANPGISKALMFVSPKKLERAWRADGTDCDVIFVAKHVCVSEEEAA